MLDLRRSVRVGLVLLLALSTGSLALTARSGTVDARVASPSADTDGEITVVTTQGFGAPTNEGDIVAVDERKRVVYSNDSLSTYHDVDPSPAGKRTVTYVGAEFLDASRCADALNGSVCTRNVIERVNLTTGDVDRLYSQVLPRLHKWHDVDRINDTHFLVADIVNHRAFALNVSSGERGWTWSAERHYSHDSGGEYYNKWVHLNDVERLPDGRVMLSIRNQDQVAFVEPGEGIRTNWTLGADDRHGILAEQHNPDYIPKERGGPAVVIADSENNRIVEYQRENGSWNRTWTWTDPMLQWPRDADRLPNGNTLVTDSNGDRVLEVAPNGTVVWSVPVALPYEAERLGTGDESDGGPAIASLGPGAFGGSDGTGTNASGMPGTTTPAAPANASDAVGGSGSAGAGPAAGLGVASLVAGALKATVPNTLLNGVLFVLPGWIGLAGLVPLATLVLSAVGLVGVEAYWRLAPRVRGDA